MKIITRLYTLINRFIFRFFSRKLLKNNSKINFGCGSNLLPGFINVDLIARRGVYPHDVKKCFPMPDASIDAIYTEHMIEHLNLQQVLVFLDDCFRLMKPNTPIRIATPNLKAFIEFYQLGDSREGDIYTRFIQCRRQELPEDLIQPVFLLNEIMSNHGHKCVMDFAYLQQILSRVGFVDIKEKNVSESEICFFKNIEGHGKVIGNEINRIETLVVEAWKR